MLKDNEILKIENLSIAFGGLKAVDDLSITIEKNQIYGLIGPNGAGKTTVFNCITQFYKPDTGKIYFNGNKGEVNLTKLKVHQVIRQGLVRTFQNVELIRELSILENVMIGAHIDFTTGVFSQTLRLPKAQKEERAVQKKAEEILEKLGITERKDMLVAGLPYGILKKVELARTFMSDPNLIILDEPAAGLNDIETLQLAQTIREIRDTMDCSVLLVEHDMRLVMDVCDRICAINFGRFLAEGTTKEIQTNKLVQEAYLGQSEDEVHA
jgi:branched-chain amino acid transport system ATP-binding protein